ncbi:DMT family transporter [Amycolatopsis sp. EV170708-02-1]|uniref:DMT family transporter n=1 Tax=Amycolatopsis sp. EV170708-02-1 TaxID=2919322 RepID=UPI001F0C1756|nr:DMT family transporter [Amycolatopsis sp. EV170708-02-1]UMP06918.1 DMT family transporter [Amycolatopsis sp. EV170708-02-1]
MVTIPLAGAAAFGWGGADYLGGRAARTAPAITVVLLSQVISAPILALFLAMTSAGGARPLDLVIGAVSGGFGLLGTVLLYGALATDGAATVAPVTAVVTALVPLIAGLFLQTAPEPLALIGAFSAVVSVALVSKVVRGDASKASMRTVAIAFSAGSALGLQLLLLTLPGPAAGLWPLAGARVCSILCAAVIVLRARGKASQTALRMPLITLVGIFDTAAYVFYLYATSHGLLSVVGPIVSLSPVSTVLLAVIIDRERIGSLHLLGLGFAAASLILIGL